MTRWRIAASAMIVAMACGVSDCSTSTTPTPVAHTGLLQGTVLSTHVATSFRTQEPPGPLYNARVEIVGGVGAGTATTTDERGEFSMTLPEGSATVRVSKPGYITPVPGGPQPVIGAGPSETSVSIESGVRKTVSLSIMVDPAVPRPDNGTTWTLTGLVQDSLGNLLKEASLVIPDFGANPTYGTGFTDPTGRFQIQSTAVVPADQMTLAVSKSGYVTERVAYRCCAGSVTVAMRGISSVTLSGPSSIVVTDSVQIMATVTYADGTSVVMTPNLLTFGVGGIMHLRNSSRGPGIVEATSPGQDAITWTYYGVTASLPITVLPG